MSDLDRPAAEYTPRPGRPAARAASPQALAAPLALALGTAAAAATVVIVLARPARHEAPREAASLSVPEPGVSAPAAPAPAASSLTPPPSPAAAAPAVGQGVLAMAPAALEAAAALPAAFAAFAPAAAAQWRWPVHLDSRRASTAWQVGGLAGPSTGPKRRLVGWYPKNAPGKRLQWAVVGLDGRESIVYEDELAGWQAGQNARAAERAQAARRQGAPIRLAAALAAGKEAVEAAVGVSAGFTGRAGELRAESMRFLPEIQRQMGVRAGSSLEQVRKAEAEAIRRAAGAASVRDVTAGNGPPTLELAYADGHTEILPYDPLVFDLSGSGVRTSPRKLLFDIAGDRRSDRIEWINDLEEGTGILVFDPTLKGGGGRDGSELFGDRTDLSRKGHPEGFVDGYAALRALVERAAAAGVISKDAAQSGALGAPELSALERAYGLGMKLGGFSGRVVSLKEAGVSSIALSGAPVQRVGDYDGRGNDVSLQPGASFTRRDGSTGVYANLWLAAKKG